MRIRAYDAIITGALILAVTACAAKQPTPPGPPTPSAPASPQPLGQSPDARTHAVGIYVEMWRAYERALAEGSADSPFLAEYADGPALLLLTRAVRSTAAAGLRGSGATLLSPKATGVHPMADPTRVTVSDCMDTSATRVYRLDGSPYADAPGGRRQMTASVALSADGKWRVNQIRLEQVGSC